MLCCFCLAHVDEVAEAVDLGWVPSFYHGDVEYEGPVCADCCRANLHLASDGEYELRPGAALPPFAIALRPRPNRRPPG